MAGNASLVIDAGDGNDTVTGGHRNDLLIGGFGVDTARFTGARADYQFVSIGSDIQVTDLRSGSPDGTDRFQAFETFAFSNASFDPLSVLLNPANVPPNNIVAGPLAVNENAGNGTLVGTVTGQDPNGQVLTYTLTDNAGGRFAIDPVSGQITVANGILLDFEQGASRGIVVTPTLRPASRRSPRLRAAGWRADSGCQRLPPV